MRDLSKLSYWSACFTFMEELGGAQWWGQPAPSLQGLVCSLFLIKIACNVDSISCFSHVCLKIKNMETLKNYTNLSWLENVK